LAFRRSLIPSKDRHSSFGISFQTRQKIPWNFRSSGAKVPSASLSSPKNLDGKTPENEKNFFHAFSLTALFPSSSCHSPAKQERE